MRDLALESHLLRWSTITLKYSANLVLNLSMGGPPLATFRLVTIFPFSRHRVCSFPPVATPLPAQRTPHLLSDEGPFRRLLRKSRVVGKTVVKNTKERRDMETTLKRHNRVMRTEEVKEMHVGSGP